MRSNRIPCAILLVLALLLGGCSFFGNSQPSATPGPSATSRPSATPNTGLPAGLTPGVTDAVPAPDGWYRVLNGQRFATQGTQPGISGSPSRSGLLVGCPLPTEQPPSAPPVLILSTDGGHTWQSRRIPGATPTPICSVLADAQQVGSFVVGPAGSGSNFSPAIYATSDSGSSWHILVPPTGFIIAIDATATTLVDRHLFAELQPTSGAGYRYAELLPDGTWQMIDEHLPYRIPPGAPQNLYTLPEAFSVDPGDPTHFYAAMYTGSVGVSLFATHDSGATWKQVYRWPTSSHVEIWTAPGNRVYAQDLIDYGTANQFFYSADGGATWTGSGLHERGADQIFVGPNGRVITLYNHEVFSLDPATGIFTKLGVAPTFRWIVVCAMSSGSQPMLVCGDAADTYARPLPAAG